MANKKSVIYFRNEAEMQVCYNRARIAVNSWIEKEDNKEYLRKKIEATYLEGLHFKNDRITLIWTNLNYQEYTINIKVIFLSKHNVELGEFVYSEDMEGNPIDDNFYFYHIYE